MGCVQILNGLGSDCDHSMGGIIEVYIANFDDVKSKKIESGIVTEITMNGSAKFKKYSLKKGSSSQTSSLNVSLENGVNYVNTDLALAFVRMDAAKNAEISKLSVGDFVVISKDGNGKYWYLGADEAVVATGAGAETGTARGDANRYTLTLNDTSVTFPPEVAESALTGIIED